MKTFLRSSAAALLLALPAVSVASQVNFSASGYPAGNASGGDMPSNSFYRSYDCRLGTEPPAPQVVITKPVYHDVTGDNKGTGSKGSPTVPPVTTVITSTTNDTPPANDPVVTDPVIPPPNDPVGVQTTTASVPLPAPGEMAGIGIAATMALSWLRSRRHVRA